MSQDGGRRQGQRAAIELKVEYLRLNTFFYDYTKNISRGGTFVRTARPLPVGTRFLFKLIVPSLDEPLALLGEVRWIRPAREDGTSEGGEPGMGIRFIFTDDRQQSAVDAIVEKMMVASLGQLIYSRLRALED
jgi:type IV pilus assembly protein PilZ